MSNLGQVYLMATHGDVFGDSSPVDVTEISHVRVTIRVGWEGARRHTRGEDMLGFLKVHAHGRPGRTRRLSPGEILILAALGMSLCSPRTPDSDPPPYRDIADILRLITGGIHNGPDRRRLRLPRQLCY